MPIEYSILIYSFFFAFFHGQFILMVLPESDHVAVGIENKKIALSSCVVLRRNSVFNEMRVHRFQIVGIHFDVKSWRFPL